MKEKLRFSRSLPLCLTILALVSYTTRAHAALERSPVISSGGLSVWGHVVVNGIEAVSGLTVYPCSEISTAVDSRAVISLGERGRAELLPESNLRLSFTEDSVAAVLDSGKLRLSAPEGATINLTTTGATIVPDPSAFSVFNVSIEEQGTSVAVHTGRVTLREGDGEIQIVAGQRYTASQNMPEANAPRHNLSGKRTGGLILLIGGLATAILLAITIGEDNKIREEEFGGNPIVPSGR